MAFFNSPQTPKLFLVTVSVALGLAIFCAPGLGAEVLPSPDLEPAKPIYCSGQQEVTLVGRTINTSGHGVEVRGNCDLTILDSHIVAGGNGVLVQSNGDVTIRGSFIQGATGALVVAGNGDVYYSGSTLRGGVREGGNGDLHDEGGNRRERIPGAADGELVASSPQRCGEDDRISIVGRFIEAEGDAIVVGEGCEALISDSLLVANGRALAVEEGATVRLRNSVLDGAGAAFDVAEDGSLHVAGTTLVGAVGGRFADGGGNSPRDRSSYRGARHSSRHGSDVGAPQRRGSGRISIGRGGIRVEGGGAQGEDSGGGAVTIGRGGIRIEGGGRSGDDAGSGSVRIGRRGIEVEGGGRDEASSPECERLCDSWVGVDEELQACAVVVLADRGYDVVAEPICNGADTRLGCRACSLALGLEPSDCGAVVRRCLGD